MVLATAQMDPAPTVNTAYTTDKTALPAPPPPQHQCWPLCLVAARCTPLLWQSSWRHPGAQGHDGSCQNCMSYLYFLEWLQILSA